MEIIIEEISRDHKLLGRHKFLKETVTIGRGYQNDIIMTDPHICPKHLSIEFSDGNWVVHDENSINGSFLEDSKASADQHIIQSGDVITLGKSQVRLLFPHHPVAKSILFSPFESLIDLMRHPMALTFSITLFAMVTGFMFYLNQSTEVNFTQFIVRAVGVTLVFALWPGLIALISHLTKHDARLLAQLGVSFTFFNLMWMTDVLESVVEFNLSSHWPVSWLITLITVGLAFCLFWLNCTIGFHFTTRKRLLVALSLTTLMFGGNLLVQLSNQPEFTIRPQYNATLLSPGFRLSPASTIESFIDDSRQLFEKAQQDIKTD